VLDRTEHFPDDEVPCSLSSQYSYVTRKFLSSMPLAKPKWLRSVSMVRWGVELDFATQSGAFVTFKGHPVI